MKLNLNLNRKLILSASIIVIVLSLQSCGPKGAGSETRSLCSPYDIVVDVNDKSMELIWKTDCKALISGYNIYITEYSLKNKYRDKELPASLKPFNLSDFPGDETPGDNLEHFQADFLENGKEYYVSVRTIFSDRKLSKPSKELKVVCYPKGEIELSIRNRSDKDGFSFIENKFVPANDLKNDIYFFSKDGADYLNSPRKSDGFLRHNKLLVLPFKGDFAEVKKEVESAGYIPEALRIKVKEGDWVVIQTEEFFYVLAKVLSISGDGKGRKIKLFYAAHTVPNSMSY